LERVGQVAWGLPVAALLATWLAAAPAAGNDDLYRWTDGRGVVHFTDAPRHASYKKLPRPRAMAGLRVFAPSQGSRDSLMLRRVGSARRLRPNPNAEIYDPIILLASQTHGVPAALVKAVIAAESAFDPGALSPKGAMGLMQLMPGTAKDLGVDEPFHDEQNVHGGTRYLRYLFDRYGDWLRTLAAYNAGPQAVDRYDGVPPYEETRQYVQRVLSYYRRFHDDFAR
jgi:soluble lytic murein transglycosylase-like protein